MYSATAASPDLPFGALLRVSNPRTHTAELIRVNDRGPFIDDRELDVSYMVACRLGLINKGITPLQVEVLEVPKRP